MRKKDILGNFIKKNPDMAHTHAIKKLHGDVEAYSALITFLPGCRDVYGERNGQQICVAGSGCKWLMYLPMNECWCITAFYSPKNEWQQWYFDISKTNFIDENGMPCTDDLFLDLIVFPDGGTKTLDADELQNALDKNEISVDDYNHAYRVFEEIKASKWSNADFLREISESLLRDYDMEVDVT